jgi:outer membrane assembly lipoprotein YfiO
MMRTLAVSAFTVRQSFYGSAMTKRFSISALMAAVALMMISCGNNDDLIGLAGQNNVSPGEAEAIYQSAKLADEKGKTEKAVKLYEELTDDFPTAGSAAQARFRQAELLEQQGDPVKAFEAYQKFLTRYRGSGLYSEALKRQVKIAHGAADGEVKTSFLGLTRNLSTQKTVEMLEKVRDNAPRSTVSAKAQFTIAKLYEKDGKPKEAVVAYRKLVRDQPDSSYAPEALFNVGMILTREADSGNRNQATLDLANEAFADYLLQYPGHSKNGEARRLMKSLKKRALDRFLGIAEFYDRTGELESAKIYYRDVVKRTKSGSAHEQAKARLKELGE